MSQTSVTLAEALWADRYPSRRVLRAVLMVTAGTALLALAAQLRIPFYPVPFTMQTFVVLVLGLTFGPQLAGVTVASYLAVGAVGAPVFAGMAGGVAVLSGATAGYLWGMLAAAVVMGFLAERGWDRSRGRTLAAMLIGTLIIFAAGLAWLQHLFGLEVAISTGLTPFLGSEAAKIALAVATVPSAWRLVGRAEDTAPD